jgi:hypothetical protein
MSKFSELFTQSGEERGTQGTFWFLRIGAFRRRAFPFHRVLHGSDEWQQQLVWE